ncbi:MAG: alpha/beta fold hydrolase [Burkholderiales bacterium]|jgi:alpha-beta hydrolase superfamily lysophospholipase|nr:alpha/beta fold hydrolase [Burkholderiales bacterium]
MTLRTTSVPLRSGTPIQLAAERWLPSARTRAALVFVHGLGEHRRARPYPPFYGALAAEGFAVLAFDLRGHGESQGPRLYARDLADLTQDLAHVVALAADEAGGRPVFVMGGSLGGLLALTAAFEPHECLAGIIAGAPALDASGARGLARRLLPLLFALAPRLRLDPGLDLSGIARDPRELSAYLDDPRLQLGRITPGLARAVLEGIERVMRRADDLELPLLLMHGLADRIVPADGTIALHAIAGARDKTLKTYPGAYHHLLLDDVRDEVTRDVLAWLGARC